MMLAQTTLFIVLIRISLGEVTVMTSGYSKYELAPFNAKETKSITFKVKGSIADVAHLGLFSNTTLMSPFYGKPFYEFVMGGWSNNITAIRKVGGYGAPVVIRYTPGLMSIEFRQFWVSWEDHVIAIGYGSRVGEDVIVSLNDSVAPMPVNYVGMTSFGWNGQSWSHTWKFNNIDLEIPKAEPQQCDPKQPMQLPMFPLKESANEIINDNDGHTCVQITATLPRTFIRMLIHDWSRPNLKLLLSTVPSCEKSGIMVFSSNGDCPLLDDQFVKGLAACTYNCTAAQSTNAKITVGFGELYDRPHHWALCEIKTSGYDD